MESPPGVNRENDLRPHSPLAREDLKLLGSEWSLTYVVCNEWICAILTKSTRRLLVKLPYKPKSSSHALKVKRHSSGLNMLK